LALSDQRVHGGGAPASGIGAGEEGIFSVSRQALWPRAQASQTFADASRPAQHQIVARIDPLAGGKLVEQRAIEAAVNSVIDVLDDGMVAQPASRTGMLKDSSTKTIP
jgi:hypothetical protein